MRLNGKRAEKPPLGCKLLDALVEKLGRVYLIVLTDRDAHARVKLTLSISTTSPLQEEPSSRQGLFTCSGRYSRQHGEKSKTGPFEELPARDSPAISLITYITGLHTKVSRVKPCSLTQSHAAEHWSPYATQPFLWR